MMAAKRWGAIMSGRSLFLILPLLLSGAALADEPIRTITVSEFQADIAKYGNKAVRVRGFINLCTPYRCQICDGPVYESKTCTNISGWRDAYAGLVLNKLYSFSEVVLQGEGFEGYYWDPVIEIDCFGMRGCTEGIAKAEVAEIVSRRAVTTLPESERGEPVAILQRLKKKNHNIADAAMLAVFAKDPRYGERIKDDPGHYVAFAVPGTEDGRPLIRGYMCWGRDNGDSASPPPSREKDLEWNSLGNPYICARAIKREGSDWQVSGHDPLFE